MGAGKKYLIKKIAFKKYLNDISKVQYCVLNFAGELLSDLDEAVFGAPVVTVEMVVDDDDVTMVSWPTLPGLPAVVFLGLGASGGGFGVRGAGVGWFWC